jgi:hypothetical protein
MRAGGTTTGCANAGSNLLNPGIVYGSAELNNGNVTSETLVTNTPLNLTQNYGFDAVNRLLSASEVSGGTAPWMQNYLYDAARYRHSTFKAIAFATTKPNKCWEP